MREKCGRELPYQVLQPGERTYAGGREEPCDGPDCRVWMGPESRITGIDVRMTGSLGWIAGEPPCITGGVVPVPVPGDPGVRMTGSVERITGEAGCALAALPPPAGTFGAESTEAARSNSSCHAGAAPESACDEPCEADCVEMVGATRLSVDCAFAGAATTGKRP